MFSKVLSLQKEYFKLFVLEKLEIQVDMRIVNDIQVFQKAKINHTIKCLSGKMIFTKNLEKYIYESKCIFPKTRSAKLILDGNYILEQNIITSNDISFKNILLIYIPNI